MPAQQRRSNPAAQKAEAVADETVTFKYQGHDYTLSRKVKLDVFDALSSVDDDGNAHVPDVKKATQALLGVEQWKVWRERNSDATMQDLEEFFATATKAVGAGK